MDRTVSGGRGNGGRATTSRYALLGMLSLGPGSGYDLKKRIEGSLAHFWSESYGQIYPRGAGPLAATTGADRARP
jgi:hypothetical protein